MVRLVRFWPLGIRCGVRCRSTSTQAMPRWPSSTARATPTGPPPTIATSYVSNVLLQLSVASSNDTTAYRMWPDVVTTVTPQVRSSGRPRSPQIDDAVLKTTLRHLAERGYAGMSINAIAAELGFSKPTIYLRWPSKINLAIAAVTSLYVDQPEALAGDVRTDLIAHVRNVQRVHATDGIGLLGSVLAEQENNPRLIAAFRECAVRPSRQRARRILQDGIRQGLIRPDADLNAAAGMLVGALYAAYVAGDDRTFDPESVVDTLLAGLAIQTHSCDGASPRIS